MASFAAAAVDAGIEHGSLSSLFEVCLVMFSELTIVRLSKLSWPAYCAPHNVAVLLHMTFSMKELTQNTPV